jgi:hypothetical protein
MIIHVAKDHVAIECKEFDYSRSKNSKGHMAEEGTLQSSAYIKKLCDEVALRIFMIQEELNR